MSRVIAAVATARGEAAIGVVRVSGKGALKVVQRVFRTAGRRRIPPEAQPCPHARVLIDPKPGGAELEIDQALAAYFQPPRTYTGEEMVELHLHGGYAPSRGAMRLLLESGAHPAEPGEFTRRAFLNGKIDLAQAEAVADLIQARTEASGAAAAAQLRGKLSEKIREMRETIADLLAETEARIDFPEDDDLDRIPFARMEADLRTAIQRLHALIRDGERGRKLRDGASAAVVGKPNVGKSSLMNQLLQRERSIVTDIPGTTRDLIEEFAELGGAPTLLTDTAGIRETSDRVEKEGVRRSEQALNAADLIILTLDISEPLDDADRRLLARTKGRTRLIAANKADLPAVWDADALEGGEPAMRVSALNGDGVDALAEAAGRRLFGSNALSAEPPLVTNLRHLEALQEAASSAELAADALRAEAPLDLAAVDLRGALHALGRIVGETGADDILDRIFSRFCIGK